MTKSKIACCYFPSTVLFIDDSKRFLNSITFELDDTIPFQLFNRPTHALQFLKNEYKTALFEKIKKTSCFNSQEYTDPTQQPITVNIADILNEIYNPKRFNEISVVVVDYAMPGMNGLEFCEKISDMPIKKILLTGEADHDLAVQAFNDGLIDRFIRKDEFNVNTNFNEILHSLQNVYFNQLSATMIANLASNTQCCLQDNAYLNLFSDYRKNNNILEYYLLDKVGSFLMLDANAVPHWLIVRTEEDIQNLVEFVEEHDSNNSILAMIKNKQALPFFGLNNPYWDVPIENWPDRLYPCHLIKTEHESFYYSTISNAYQDQITQQDILSFADFLE